VAYPKSLSFWDHRLFDTNLGVLKGQNRVERVISGSLFPTILYFLSRPHLH
jgi:hypothetical protein